VSLIITGRNVLGAIYLIPLFSLISFDCGSLLSRTLGVGTLELPGMNKASLSIETLLQAEQRKVKGDFLDGSDRTDIGGKGYMTE